MPANCTLKSALNVKVYVLYIFIIKKRMFIMSDMEKMGQSSPHVRAQLCQLFRLLPSSLCSGILLKMPPRRSPGIASPIIHTSGAIITPDTAPCTCSMFLPFQNLRYLRARTILSLFYTHPWYLEQCLALNRCPVSTCARNENKAEPHHCHSTAG
jgi:hypothetical protein